MSFTSRGNKKKDSRLQFDPPTKDLCSKLHTPIDNEQIPIKEFLDVDINNEKWDTAITSKHLTPNLERKTSAIFQEYFEDPYIIYLPPSIQAYEWKKIDEIFPDATFIIKNELGEYPNLKKGSQHLLHSEFVRNYISSIESLFYLGNTNQFPVEYTSPSFSPSFEKDSWRPWNHIYCNCKSGKSYSHNPTHNNIGKYIVRLFWLGSWRKVYVSDKFPVNEEGEIMLPACEISIPKSTSVMKAAELDSKLDKEKKVKEKSTKEMAKGGKKEKKEKSIVPIWSYLLSKALMVLASLSWTKENELVDFDIIQCLTGWVPHKIYTRTFDFLTIWKTCLEYTKQYTWPDVDVNKKGKGKSDKKSDKSDKSSTSDKSSKTKESSKTDKDSKTSKKTKDEKKGKAKIEYLKKPVFHRIPKPIEVPIDKNNFIFTIGIELESLEYDHNWKHTFLVPQTRTVPLLKPSTDEEFEPWKRYRWIDWAISNKLINPRAPPHPIKSFQTVDPFREKYRDLISEKSVVDVQVLLESRVEISTSRTEKSDKSQKTKDKKQKKGNEYKDVTDWLNYEDIYNALRCVTVYYKGSSFKVKVRVSNFSSENIKKEVKYPFARKLDQLHGLEWKEIIHPECLQSQRNQPVYLFCDSLFPQTIVMNLSQIGYTNVWVDEEDEEVIGVIQEELSECGLCETTFLNRVKQNCERRTKTFNLAILNAHRRVHKFKEHPTITSSVILSSFLWNSNDMSESILAFSSFGSNVHVLHLKPGRHVNIIWVHAEGPYCLQVYSNTMMCVGNLEEVLTIMSNPSMLFRHAYFYFVEELKNLINCFGTPDYLEALRSFCRCYKPAHGVDTSSLNTIHETFQKEFFAWILETHGVDAFQAIKILFLKWQFEASPCDFDDYDIFCYGIEEEDTKYVKIMHESATKLQAFFRGIYERKLLARHNPASPSHVQTAEILYKISEKCDEQDRIMGAHTFRRFMENALMINFSEKYPWHNEMMQQIWLAEFSYGLSVFEPGWILITRQVFYIRPGPPLLVRIHLFSDIEKYVLRVFDNDTSLEMSFYINNVGVTEYEANSSGYTLVAYGWSTTACYINFKVIYACQEENLEELIYFPAIVPKREILSQYYIPNAKNYIERYILTIKSDLSISTIHLFTSYSGVKIHLKIFPKSHPNEILIETTGVGSVTVPYVWLHSKFRQDSRRFKISESDKSIKPKAFKKSTQRPSRLKIHMKRPSVNISKRRFSTIEGESVHRGSQLGSGHGKSKIKIHRMSKASLFSKRLSIVSDTPEFNKLHTSKLETFESTEQIREVYMIEASVIDDSWPLTEEEWRRVDEERVRRLSIGTLLENEVEVSMRDSIESMKITKVKSAESIVKDGPFSTIIVYYNNNDEITLSRNTEKEEYIKKLKLSWYESDPGRYERAQAIRDDFLERNKIPNLNICTNPETRSLSSEIFQEKIIPPLDITPYLTKPLEEVKIRVIKNKEDISKDVQEILNKVTDYEIDLEEEDDNLENYMVKQYESFETIHSWFEEIQDDSKWMMDQVTAARMTHLENLRDLVNPKRGKKNAGTEKKKKK